LPAVEIFRLSWRQARVDFLCQFGLRAAIGNVFSRWFVRSLSRASFAAVTVRDGRARFIQQGKAANAFAPVPTVSPQDGIETSVTGENAKNSMIAGITGGDKLRPMIFCARARFSQIGCNAFHADTLAQSTAFL
jgi:hypothetical protein